MLADCSANLSHIDGNKKWRSKNLMQADVTVYSRCKLSTALSTSNFKLQTSNFKLQSRTKLLQQ
jgi:hypothetical protein